MQKFVITWKKGRVRMTTDEAKEFRKNLGIVIGTLGIFALILIITGFFFGIGLRMAGF